MFYVSKEKLFKAKAVLGFLKLEIITLIRRRHLSKKKKKERTLSLMIISLCKQEKTLRIKCRQDQNLFLDTPSTFLLYTYHSVCLYSQMVPVHSAYHRHPFAMDLIRIKKDSTVLSLRSQNIASDFISSWDHDVIVKQLTLSWIS